MLSACAPVENKKLPATLLRVRPRRNKPVTRLYPGCGFRPIDVKNVLPRRDGAHLELTRCRCGRYTREEGQVSGKDAQNKRNCCPSKVIFPAISRRPRGSLQREKVCSVVPIEWTARLIQGK